MNLQIELQRFTLTDIRVRWFILITCLTAALLITGLDRLSGPEVTVSVLYVIPVAICSYYLGLRSGILISLVCLVGYVLTASVFLGLHAAFPINYWNVGVRLLFFFAIAYVLSRRRRAEEKLTKSEERSRIYVKLHELDQAILALDTQEAIAREALEGLIPLIPCDVSSVAVFDGDHFTVRMLAHKWVDSTEPAVQPAYMGVSLKGAARILEQGMVNHITEGSPQPAGNALKWLLSAEVKSYLNVPMLSQGKLIGALNFGSFREGGFTKAHIDIARQVAHQLAIAIHNSRLFEDLKAAHSRLKLLSQTLLKVQEVEKHHLARELHDEMGQTLTALQIQLEDIASSCDSPNVSAQLEQSVRIVEGTLERVRNISLDLRPLILDDLGLVAAVRWYVSRTSQLAGFAVHFESNLKDVSLSADIQTVIFRVVQEALTNVLRHARATEVWVEITLTAENVILTIRDNGMGFEQREAEMRVKTSQSLGLLGMRERVTLVGGAIEIESQPSAGTTIGVRLPVSGDLEASR